ncbi:MAG: NupC/NupG family nucleoside CNT transporter, partial [Microcoleaceae cyanobacterium]
MERFISAIGLIVFLGFAYAVSRNRQAINWHTVAWGIGLQIIFAILILKTQGGLILFQWLGDVVTNFLNFGDAGSKFLFGENFTEHFIAFKVLPTIVYFSAVITVLYHYGILQKAVQSVARLMMKTMKTSGAESLSCAANIFVGQTEAPLLIRPYIESLTISELHAVMTGGFATIAGGVMAAYISFGISPSHLIAASVMSAPAALVISKMFVPETEHSLTAGRVAVEVKRTHVNVIDAAADGARNGGILALNVAAMLIAFLGILALINGVLGSFGQVVGLPQLSLEWFFSYIFAPVAWLMGIPWQDCLQVGILLGKKTILNEFIAYLDLQKLITDNAISERSQIIVT